MNNPLLFTDPSGYKPVALFEEEGRLRSSGGGGGGWNPFGWINKSMSNVGWTEKIGPSFDDLYVWVPGLDKYVKKSDLVTYDFASFYDDLSEDINGEDFKFSLTFQNDKFWVLGKSKVTEMTSSFSGLNSSNYILFEEASVIQKRNQYRPMLVNFGDIDGMPASVTGYLKVDKTNKGKYYAQAIMNISLNEMNGYKYEAIMTILNNNSERSYGGWLSTENEWGIESRLKSSNSRYMGSATFLLPEFGDVDIEIRLNTYKIRWWDGNTLASPLYFIIPIIDNE